MSKRTRQRRSRPRRDKGSGVSPPTRNKTETKWDTVGKRVDVSYDVLGHPQQASKPVEEGKHFTTLAYTDWCDTFVPTVVKWNHGAVDSFTDLAKSRENQAKAIQHARSNKASSMSQSIRLPESKIPELKEAVQQMKKAAKDEKEKYGKPGPMTLKDLRSYQAELRKARAESGAVKKPVRVRKMFERHGVPIYGIWNQEKQKWLHEDGSWTDPYPEKGLMWYAIKPEIAKQKLKEIKPSGMSRKITLPVGGGTLKVGGKEYIWRTGDRSYEAAQEKAKDLRRRGHKAVIRKEKVAGKPTYVVYARKEGAK